MKKTKEKGIFKKVFYGVLSSVFTAVLIFFGIGQASTFSANGATLYVHNYVTDDTFQYSGNTVVYEVNGELLTSISPGLILSNGAAVGPFDAIFVDMLGAKSDYIEGKKSFTISYGTNSINMTLGNTEATVNGVKCTMNNAPFVYSFNDSTEKLLYVPTRFVAETFGYEYIWNASSSTATINKTNLIYDGKEAVKYTGASPVLLFNNKTIDTSVFPGYVFDDVVFFSAEEHIEKSGIASFTYAEGSGLIVLQSGDIMVRLVLGSPIAYINDDAHLLTTVPRQITPQGSSKSGIYVPAKFVFEAFGYTTKYAKTTDRFQVFGTVSAQSPETEDAGISDLLPDTVSYGDILFSYETPEQLLDYYTDLGENIPKGIYAYSCSNSDAIYLKGVDSSQIKIIDKTDILEITIPEYHNPYTGKLKYVPEASFLNYFYFSTSDTLKILIIKTKELQYYAYSASNGCVIHLTDVNGMYQDSLKFDTASDSASDTTNLYETDDLSTLLPEAVFSRDNFVIRLPEDINIYAIDDLDEYDKKRFTISIPGNHMKFLSEQEVYNPVSTLSNVQFSHRVSDNTTLITFNTTKIQGYSMTIADGFLAVKIANPKEIYDKIIVVDAGHGGIDPGTLRGSVYEKTVNYNVINVYAQEYFKDSDIKVYYTRTTDTKIALQTRADFAATVGADLFISFHVNANSTASVNGTSVYYSKSNNKTTASGLSSSILATSIVNHLSNAWNTKNRGIIADKFVVIHNNSVPAVLVECGFITNDSDFAKIKDTSYQKKAAKALFDAVTEIFEKYPTKR